MQTNSHFVNGFLGGGASAAGRAPALIFRGIFYMLSAIMENERNGQFDREAALARRINSDPQLAALPALYDRLPQSEWYLVGGAVRDFLMDRGQIKDFDLVVRRAQLDEVTGVLEERGKVDLVGRNFGVLKFWPKSEAGAAAGEEPLDIAWPRTEKAGGSGGYRDFQVQADPELPIERDLARRDFTINALAWDMKLQRVIDPFGGRGDIEQRTIRAVGDPEARFREDYSRMLRAIRLACQLDFKIEPATWEAIKRCMPRLDDERTVGGPGQERTERVVPFETVAKELAKALAADPRRALELFESSGALFRLMPELERLAACSQSPEQHSEGDVWTHTKLALAKLTGPEFGAVFPGEKPSTETVLALLLHDVAKPETAAHDGERITFYGHEERGSHIVRSVSDRLKLPSAPGVKLDSDRLAWLVKNHLFPNLVRVDEVRKTTLFKYFLADREAGRQLLHLAFADASASIPRGGAPDLSNLRRLLEALAELERQIDPGTGKPPRLLTGKEIMSITGLEPGPGVGRVMELLAEAQLRGEVANVEQAREFLQALPE